MTISEKIKTNRIQKQMTQKELSLRSSIGESAIRMYELGARTPKLEQLVKIAKALDISVYSLIFPDLKVHGELVKALYYCDSNVKIVKNDNGKLCVEFNNSHINNDLKYWYEIQQKYFNGKISKDDYNEWVINFPHSCAINAPEKFKKLNDL